MNIKASYTLNGVTVEVEHNHYTVNMESAPGIARELAFMCREAVRNIDVMEWRRKEEDKK